MVDRDSIFSSPPGADVSRSWAARGARRQMLFVGVSSLCFIAIDAVAESFIYSTVYLKNHIKERKIVEEGKQKQQNF